MIMTETVNLVQQLDVFYYHNQMFINEWAMIINHLHQENLIILIEITTLSNDIDIVNVNTVIYWLDVYLLLNLIQQNRHANYQKKKIYSVLLLNFESQNVILFNKFNNNKTFKFYVNNSQYMFKILFEHLNDNMRLLNYDLFWFCIFCESETFKLVNN